MTSSHAHVRPTGWLFTRGDASVRMTVDERAAGVALIVRGPGTASTTYDFPDMDALMEFAARQEEQLQQDGFHLQAIAERRSEGGAREPRPGLPDRRRR